MAYPQTRFSSVTIDDSSLIGQRRNAVKSSTLSYQLDVLKKTGRYDAFKLEWKDIYKKEPTVWPIPDHLFWDSDIAKWIEGACYYLQDNDMPEIDAAVKELVDMIRSAQHEDGYLNIHYTMVEPGKRFTNLRDMHELYNAGHLIEAALAHNQVYGDDRLMEPILKYVDLLCRTFGQGCDQIHGYPGHPEIELALLRLYDRTADVKHLHLAEYFLTERGSPDGADGRPYYVVEAEKRGEAPRYMPHYYPAPMSLWYHQAHKPIVEQEKIEGHAVRAMYLLTAVADLVSHDDQEQTEDLRNAVYRLWDNMTQCKMYVTGGIGAIEQWEGFGIDHFLPQGTDEGGCYAETCAAIGVMMLSERILRFDRDARFADVMELCLYNAVLTAMSSDGKAFTYINQLASSDKTLSKREDWFTVACCPPNVLRILGQIGGYVWAYVVDEEQCSAHVNVHLYIPSAVKFNVGGETVEIKQESEWPWHGDIEFSVRSANKSLSLSLRIPNWAPNFVLMPECPSAVLEKGYLTLPPDYISTNTSFKLQIPIKSEWIVQNTVSKHDTVALRRGPIIYCAEDVDNDWVEDHFRGTFVDTGASLVEKLIDTDVVGNEYIGITLENGARSLDLSTLKSTLAVTVDELAQNIIQGRTVDGLHFVPYYFRANRGGRGQMRVGFRRF